MKVNDIHEEIGNAKNTMLTWMCGVTLRDRKRLRVDGLFGSCERGEEVGSYRPLRWYGHNKRKAKSESA